MLERKGLGIRFGAAVIDTVITIAVTAVLAMIVGPLVGGLVGMAICLAYPLIEIAKAQSPGKMILKLKIYAENGGPATRQQLVQRTLIRWSPTLVSAVFSLIGAFAPAIAQLGGLASLALSIGLLVLSWQTLQTTKQCFWDVKAKTAVMGPVGAGLPIGFPVQPAAAETPAAPATNPPAQV
jgi:uncharacterized RDD family membrane protein YckC